MAGFTTEWTVDSGDLTITLPFTNNGTYNATIYWGDTSNSTVTSYDSVDRIHTYASPGVYEVSIFGSAPGWSFANSAEGAKCTDVINWGTSADFDGFDYFQQAFRGSSIVSAGNEPILLNSGASNLFAAFRDCTSLASVPENLFSNGVSFITHVYYAFTGCTSLIGNPPTLAGMTNLTTTLEYCSGAPMTGGSFAKMTGCSSVTNARRMFYNSSGLSSIAARCYEDLTSNLEFTSMHQGCNNLAMPLDAFCGSEDYGTRFLNQSPDFDYFFFRSSFTGAKGFIPDPWKCDFGTGAPNTTLSYINNSAESESTADNFTGVPGSGQPVNWYGPTTISDPSISAVSDDTVSDGQNITVTGDTFAYDCDFYLTDNSDWDSSTTFVMQTLNSVTETGGDIDIDYGTLTGTAYLHAEHYRNQNTGTGGYALTLDSGASTNSCTVVSISAASEWLSTTVQQNTASASFIGSSSTWATSAEMHNNASVSFESDAGLWVTNLTQINTATVEASSSASQWLSDVIQNNDALVSFDSSAAEWVIIATDAATNTCSIVATSAASVFLSEVEQHNHSNVLFVSSASAWTTEAAQHNNAVVAAESAAPDWSASLSQINMATVEATAAASQWMSELIQQNDVTVSFSSAASEWFVLLGDAATNTCTVIATSAASVFLSEVEQHNYSSVSFVSGSSYWNIQVVQTELLIDSVTVHIRRKNQAVDIRRKT